MIKTAKMTGTATLALATAMMAYAAPSAAFAQEDEADSEVFFITGSRIPQPNLTSTSPITQVDAEEIDVRGIVRVEDMVNNLPQAFAAQGASYANGATGTAQVNLRGLGASRTLVLTNGKRMPYGSPISTPTDLNQIPAALIERVEVVTGGASAVYGSDALAGVVNFIMVDDFEGVRVDANYHWYQHNNDNGYFNDLLTEQGRFETTPFDFPDDRADDGHGGDLSIVLGTNTPDGNGNVTAYLGYSSQDAVYQGDRDYAGCALARVNGGQDFGCGGSSAAATANIFDAAAGFGIVNVRNGGVYPESAADAEPQRFNYNPYNHYLRPSERYTAGFFANYEINRHFKPYAELQFMDYTTDAQIAPSGTFNNTDRFSCENPFLSAEQYQYFCVDTAAYVDSSVDYDGDGIGDPVRLGAYINRRNVEGGARSSFMQHKSFRFVAGMEGDINDTWTYDVYGITAKVDRNERYENDLHPERLQNSLLVDADGNCYSGGDCVPYNPFGTGAITDDMLEYLYVDLTAQGSTELNLVSGTVTGMLGDYGIASPWATSGFGIAAGLEYREYRLEVVPDENYAAGNGTGQGGPYTPVEGDFDVLDYFVELDAPLIEGAQFAEELTLSAAYRYSEYSTGISSDSYMVGLDWQPISDLRFRTSYQEAVRAPNVIELFSPQSIGLFDLPFGDTAHDPCAGATPDATAAQCALSGVTAAQYGSIPDNPAGQFNVLGGGNPDLAPEKGQTFSIGFVATPSFIEGLTFSVDYFNIEITDGIGTISPDFVVQKCIDEGVFCENIQRDGAGSLWLTQDAFVQATNLNVAQDNTSGFDIQGSYGLDLPEGFGGLSFDYVGTYLDELSYIPADGEDTVECVGLFNTPCGTPNPQYRHKARMGWDVPGIDMDVNLTWRYYDSVERQTPSDAIDGSFDSFNYFDLAAQFDVFPNDTTFTIGMNNVLDEEPPVASDVGAGAGNGNTYAQVYDALGRYIFMGVSADF